MTRNYHQKMQSPYFIGHSKHPEVEDVEAIWEAKIILFLRKFKFWTFFRKKSN